MHRQQTSNVAVAVSGTVVLETALANLPTVAIYRANLVTEWVAKRLAAVRFVSLPNLLLGKYVGISQDTHWVNEFAARTLNNNRMWHHREIIPELLFRDCTADNIAQALRCVANELCA